MDNRQLTDSQMGDICEQYYVSRLKEIADNSPVGGSGSQTSSKDKSADELTRTLVQRIAVAGLKRTIRNSRFDNPTAFIDFFHFELGDDWSSLLAASKMTAKIILDGESEVTGASSDEIEILATLKEPFKALWRSAGKTIRTFYRLYNSCCKFLPDCITTDKP
mgnify:CR=1 FL=1